MYRKVHSPFGECFFNFLGEHDFGADFRESHIGNLVAGSLDDFELYLMSVFAQQCADVMSLPKR
jgi:hypothetical protein